MGHDGGSGNRGGKALNGINQLCNLNSNQNSWIYSFNRENVYNHVVHKKLSRKYDTKNDA